MKGSLQRILGYLWAPTAFLAVATALPAHAALDDDRGKIIIEMEGGVSEARWVDGSPGTQPPAGATQLLGQANPCLLVPQSVDLLNFTANVGTNEGPVGAKFDSIGVDLLGGNGTGCSSTDENRGDQEALTIALGPEVADLSVKLWILELS